MSSFSSRHPRLPAERFLWAVLTPDLPTAALRRMNSAKTRAVLDEAFASHLPMELGQVAAAYTLLPDGTVLACALPDTALEEPELADAVTLAPATLPQWLDQSADPEQLNVLIRSHEPDVVTVARRRRSAVLTGAVALLAAAVWIGLERRADASRVDRMEAESAISRLTTSADAVAIGLTPSANLRPDSFAFVIDRELAKLRATRNKQASLGLSDAVDPLASLLARWPSGVKTQVQSLSATPGLLSVSVLVPELADAERLSAALAGTQGWESSQPQITSNGKRVQVLISLKPAPKRSVDKGPTP
ncbi:MAG: hypothetical protein AABZ53_05225 [Planctomycetota bacterium]